MDAPNTDDFRIEHQGDQIAVIFTPDGRSYTFRIEGDRLSDPVVSPAQVKVADYAKDEVRKAATELARLALKGAPSGEASPSQPR
ncbi:hypothetical protein [Microvirga sp. 2TAF3]|uniref:hypothetical protein n=1 Tax=Microvirga sp. 2TAF3 TaxID=3233014 RepID=UPI003F9B8A93